MNKRLLFVLSLLFVGFSSFVSAVDVPSDGYFYYNFTNLTDYWNSIIITNNGADSDTSFPSFGISGSSGPNSFDCDGISEYLTVPHNSILNSDNFSISFWINTNVKESGDRILSKESTSNGYARYNFLYDGSGNLELVIYNTVPNSFTAEIPNADITTGTWYNIIGTYNSTSKEVEIFLNSVSKDTATLTGTRIAGDTQPLQICRFDSDYGLYFNGKIDEVKYFNRTINQTEINQIYSYGKINITVPVSNVTKFSITSFSEWDNSVVSNFSALINGTIYNTTNGTIITPFNQSQGLEFNITISSSDWFSRTYEDYNISSDLVAVIKQSEINVSFKFSSGDFVFTPINLTSLDTGEFFNVTNGSEIIFPNAGFNNFSVRCDNNVFAPFNMTLNITALDNNTFEFTVNETQNVITFLDGNTSNPIVNGTVIVTFPSSFELNLTTNSSGQINFSYIQNNSLEFGDYNYFFSKLGFVVINLSDVINESNIPHSRTYNISRAKLTINVYDRVTRDLLDWINVSIAFIGLFNETTTNGTLVKDNLSIVGGDYLVYASAEDYKTSVRSLTFTNQEEFTLNFYLMNLSDPNIGTIFVTTSDTFFRKITGAKVELLEYVPSSLSYVSVAECVTNINSECAFSVELNVKVYYLRATTLVDGEYLVAETSQNGEIFTVNNDVRNLIFYTRPEFIISPVDNLIYDIDESFVNNVSEITVEFNSYDGSAIEVCIEYFRKNGTSFVSVTGDTYCLVSSSAIQNLGVSITLNRSNDYEARIYIKQATGDLPLRTYSYPSITSSGEIFDDDTIGAIIMIVWVFTLAFCLHSKNMTLWCILAVILPWVEVLIFPLYSIVAVSVFKTIIAGFTIIIARKKKDLT